MIDHHHPIPQHQRMQAAHGKRPLLMGREPPDTRPSQADLEPEKERGAMGEGQVHERVRFTPAVLEGAQGQEGIEEGAAVDQDREPHDPWRETIPIRLAALQGPPKAVSSPSPAQRAPERRGTRARSGSRRQSRESSMAGAPCKGCVHASQRVRI